MVGPFSCHRAGHRPRSLEGNGLDDAAAEDRMLDSGDDPPRLEVVNRLLGSSRKVSSVQAK
jgi:hypothetical protein